MERKALESLVESLGERYSEVLKINLASKDEKEIFKWFLASVLFGAPITETSVIRTYKCFEKQEVLAPNKILETGWNGLVEILDEGRYTRYDFKTASKLLEVMGNLNTKYSGSLNKLHEDATDSLDLEKRVKKIYSQMPCPRYVIAMGACAISGGLFYNSYNIIKGVDKILPVDVYVPGCPPRPEALAHAVLLLQDKIRKGRVNITKGE